MSEKPDGDQEAKAVDALITGALHAWSPKEASPREINEFLSMKVALNSGESAALRGVQEKLQGGDGSPGFAARPSAMLVVWLLAMMPCGYLWFRLIHNLSVEWGTNPQYAYGYLVPFLCIGLLARRWHGAPQSVKLSRPPISLSGLCALLLCSLAFLYLPTRLIEGSTPEWRLIQWLLAVEAVGLTLCMVYLTLGRAWLMEMAFPICMFLVAVPWPTQVEQPIIQGLTRASGSVVVEVLGVMGIPALQHGNLIEISTGSVGINEACSGIRSFQTSFMISLFFGEFYRLRRSRRFWLVPIALMVSMICNIVRMTLLTSIAARKGTEAISKYHDPAGISISIICTTIMWGVAMLLHHGMVKANQRASGSEAARAEAPQAPAETGRLPMRGSFLGRVSVAMIVWFVMVEIGVQAWYSHLESGIKAGPSWTINFPKENPTLQQFTIDETTKDLLRYDEGKEAEWINPDGIRMHAFYCEWFPGRVAGYLAKRHTPEICLAATGQKQIEGPELMVTNINGITLPVRRYVFQTETGRLIYVYHCRWEAGATAESYTANESARFNLLRGIWAGRGKHGQKVLEIFITGLNDKEVAYEAFIKQAKEILQVGDLQVGMNAARP